MSSRFETSNKIEIFETNGSENQGLRSDRPKIDVMEHWNRREFVRLKIKDETYTVSAQDLIKAVENAQNAHTF